MFKHFVRFSVGLALFALVIAPAPGQQQDFRRFFKPPETPREFWDALNFEVNVGRFDLAAAHLKGLLAAVKDHDEELLKIEEQEGLSAFLRLRLIAKWSDKPDVNKEAKQNVEELLQQTSRALKNYLTNPDRIAKFTKNLSAPTAEERGYALMVLQRSGAAAVPHLIAVLRDTPSDAPEHMAIVAALPRLNKDTVPALIAALDVKEANVRAELIDVLRQRIERDAVPFLWYYSASRAQPDLVRQKATEALLLLTQTKKAADLPPAKLALTREADRYYRHLVYKDRATPVTVWRWDAKKAELASQALPVTQAEEYYGMRFAREALDLDASYQPAQVVLASLVLEKAYERAGIDQPLPRETMDLLTTLNFDVLAAVLRRGLIDRRVPAILGSVKALGDLGDLRAARSGSNSTPVLVQALNYPDRRVQMAATEALLRIPNQPSSESTARIVELLRRALAAEPEAGGEAAKPRALVAHFSVERANEIARAVRQAGFQVGPDDVARTGRELLNRLARSADVDIVLIDAALPYPELPYLMAQLRADRDSGLLPVLVLSPPDKELHLNRLLERYLYVWVVPEVIWRDPAELKSTLSARISDAMGKPLSNDELKNYAGTAIRWLNRMAVGEVSGYDVRPAADAILKAMRSDDLAALAIETAGHLPGALPQRELAQVVLDNARNPKLRAAAAIQLARHIQQRGAALSRDQVKGIGDLYLSTNNDPKLKGNLATVLGCLRPDVSESGRRLREYTPPAPAAPAAPEKEK